MQQEQVDIGRSAGQRREPDLMQRFDAIVVGSGPGGATVARELTRRGWKVLIIERGDERPVTGSMRQTLRELWTPGRGLLLADRLLAVLRGITVGGSSVYSWGTAWDPPHRLFERHGIDLRDGVDEARRELRVAPLSPERMGRTARRVMQSAIELGYDWKPLPTFFDQSRLGGPPMGSYNAPSYEAKWNARMFVDEAVARGASLLTRANVLRVVVRNGVAKGVELEHRGHTRTVLGAKVIVAAGGIGSAVILQASGLRHVGRSFFCDPLLAVVGSLPGPEHAEELPMTAGSLFENEGYLLTDMSLPRWMYSLVTAEVGRVDELLAYPRTALIMVMIRDDREGGVTSRGRVHKPLTDADRRKLARGTERAKEILAHAGAQRLFHTWLFAVHPGGTAPIGHVVDADLQTDIENLYVCDASVIPEPWGLPPTLTLIGLGKRLSAHLHAPARERWREPRNPAPPSPNQG